MWQTRQAGLNVRSPSASNKPFGPAAWMPVVLAFTMIWAFGGHESIPREMPHPLLDPSGIIQQHNSGRFTLGSTKDDVLAIQGTPTRIIIAANSSTWYYGFSNVHFASGRVVSWDISPGDPLKVKKALRE